MAIYFPTCFFITEWAREQEFELLLVWPSDESYDFYTRLGFKNLRDPLVLPLKGI